MNETLKRFLIETLGLAADADDATAKKHAAAKLKSGELDPDKYTELLTPKATAPSKLDQLADLLAKRIGAPAQLVAASPGTAELADSIARHNLKAHTIGGDGASAGSVAAVADSPIQAADVFGPVNKAVIAGGGPGGPRVKRASEWYDATPGRLKTYAPTDPRQIAAFSCRENKQILNQPIMLNGASEGREIREQSVRQKALAGAFFQHMFAAGGAFGQNLTSEMSDHTKDLVMEAYTDELFVGDVWDPDRGCMVSLHKPQKLTEGMRKTLLAGSRLPVTHKSGIIADATTGGTYLVPYYFDVDVVTYPLLTGELFPFVDLQELDGSNQVIRGTMKNLTINEGPTEGDQNSAITLETVTSIITQLTFNIYPATGGILIGRDFLSDSPVDFQALIYNLYKIRLAQWLDKEIAIGAGTSGPTGLSATSSPLTFTFTNGSAGPLLVKDIVNFLFTLTKAYRVKNPAVCFVGNDTFWQIIRRITVNGTTDQRLIFGYDVEKYMMLDRPFRINNDMTQVQSFVVDLSRFQMWRRKGLQFEFTTDGKTLMLANEALVTIRTRWGGKMVDSNAIVYASNSPKS